MARLPAADHLRTLPLPPGIRSHRPGVLPRLSTPEGIGDRDPVAFVSPRRTPDGAEEARYVRNPWGVRNPIAMLRFEALYRGACTACGEALDRFSLTCRRPRSSGPSTEDTVCRAPLCRVRDGPNLPRGPSTGSRATYFPACGRQGCGEAPIRSSRQSGDRTAVYRIDPSAWVLPPELSRDDQP